MQKSKGNYKKENDHNADVPPSLRRINPKEAGFCGGQDSISIGRGSLEGFGLDPKFDPSKEIRTDAQAAALSGPEEYAGKASLDNTIWVLCLLVSSFFVFALFYGIYQDMVINPGKLTGLFATTRISLSIFAIIAVASLPVIFYKRKISLSIEGQFFCIRCFPDFSEKIRLEQVVSCRVNAFSNEPFDSGLMGTADRKIKVDPAKGVVVLLKNGTIITLGSQKASRYIYFKDK